MEGWRRFLIFTSLNVEITKLEMKPNSCTSSVEPKKQ